MQYFLYYSRWFEMEVDIFRVRVYCIIMKYVEFNLNPSGKKAADCVVRAIMKAMGKPWSETYSDLCKLGLELFDMPNAKRVFAEYLNRNGWQRMPMPRFSDNTRYTVKEFADKYNNGIYIISVANHVTVIIDGVLFDTWDCSRKSIGNFWQRSE